MSDFSIYDLSAIQDAKHIAAPYLAEFKLEPTQAILLSATNPVHYQIAKPSLNASLTFYSNEFSDVDFAEVTNRLDDAQVKVSAVEIVSAPDNKTEAALSWILESDLSVDTLSDIKSWAKERHIDVWLLNERPSLSEPGLLLMDMDSTTIKIECIDEIAKLAGVGEEVAKVTELAMEGKLDFAESLRARVATLTDADESIIAKVKDNLPLMHGLERLITVLKQHNWRVAIASGGFTYFADKLKADLELDAAIANNLEVVDGKLTGKVLGGIVDAQVKADSLGKLAKEFGIAEKQTIAMGDGANDLVMMAAANLGVAFEAKPVVQEKADVAINHHGLDALLFILNR